MIGSTAASSSVGCKNYGYEKLTRETIKTEGFQRRSRNGKVAQKEVLLGLNTLTHAEFNHSRGSAVTTGPLRTGSTKPSIKMVNELAGACCMLISTGACPPVLSAAKQVEELKPYIHKGVGSLAATCCFVSSR